jgi:hypothetical protein
LLPLADIGPRSLDAASSGLIRRTIIVETLPHHRVLLSISGRREKDRLVALSPKSDRVF